MAKVMKVLIFLGLFWHTFAREILSYVDGSTMRREDGEPGSRVTGEWRWMDQSGKERTIRYVADTNGFRAYGDLVPDDWTSPSNNNIPLIGSSVVPAMKSNPTFIGDLENTVIPKVHKKKQPTQNTKQSKKVISDSETEFSEPRNTILLNDQDAISNVINEIKPTLNTTNNDKPSSNDANVASIVDTASKNNMKVSFIPGTNIVLLSKRLPTTFAEEILPTGEKRIKPIPVEKTGLSSMAITGILTAPRAKHVLLKDKKAKTFPKSTNRRAPQSSRVDGMLNLDNFLRPALIPTPNSDGSLTPNPAEVLDYDYYYYDDYMYPDDNVATNDTTAAPSANLTSTSTTSTTSSPITTTTTASTTTTTTTTSTLPLTTSKVALKSEEPPNNHRRKSKKQRSTRSEESLEESLEDSLEISDDSNEHK